MGQDSFISGPGMGQDNFISTPGMGQDNIISTPENLQDIISTSGVDLLQELSFDSLTDKLLHYPNYLLVEQYYGY